MSLIGPSCPDVDHSSVLFGRSELAERTKRAGSSVLYSACLFAAPGDVAPSSVPLPPMDFAHGQEHDQMRFAKFGGWASRLAGIAILAAAALAASNAMLTAQDFVWGAGPLH